MTFSTALRACKNSLSDSASFSENTLYIYHRLEEITPLVTVVKSYIYRDKVSLAYYAVIYIPLLTNSPWLRKMIISQLELGPPVDHVGGSAFSWKQSQPIKTIPLWEAHLIPSDVKSSQRYIASTTAMILCLWTDSTWKRATRIYVKTARIHIFSHLF